MTKNSADTRPSLPRLLYEEADKLDVLGRRESINSPLRRRVLDISEQLREAARLEMRLGIPY